MRILFTLLSETDPVIEYLPSHLGNGCACPRRWLVDGAEAGDSLFMHYNGKPTPHPPPSSLPPPLLPRPFRTSPPMLVNLLPDAPFLRQCWVRYHVLTALVSNYKRTRLHFMFYMIHVCAAIYEKGSKVKKQSFSGWPGSSST